MRRAGHTIREIQAALGTKSSRKIAEWLRGVPPNPSVFKGKAKVDERERARELRAEGRSLNEIAATLGVSKSSVSVWCRDVFLTEEQRAALALPSQGARLKRAAGTRAARIRRTEILQGEAAAEIGELSDRELFLVGVALYWAEGSKQKPWRPSGGVSLINSDPQIIRLYLAWLRLLGIPSEDLTYRIVIHDSANVDVATAHWAKVAGTTEAALAKPTIKRHRPTTVRRNTGEGYAGCLVVGVRRSTDLNRRIEGWWAGIVAGVRS